MDCICQKMSKFRRLRIFLFIPCLALLVASCSASEKGRIPLEAEKVYVAAPENNVPGTVNKLWVEPIVQTVEVPAQLDPNGVYYRPAHNELVEIRPGKYQRQQFITEKRTPHIEQQDGDRVKIIEDRTDK